MMCFTGLDMKRSPPQSDTERISHVYDIPGIESESTTKEKNVTSIL